MLDCKIETSVMNFHKITLLVITLFLVSNFSYSQSKEIKIKFLGNCGLYITDGKLNLYIDFPYKSGAYGYMKYEKSEIDSLKNNSIFLFTHRHADHYSKKILKEYKSKHSGKFFGNWNVKKIERLNNSIEDFKIEPFKTKHKFTFKHYSYLLTWHGKKMFFSGDTEDIKTIKTLKNIDWVFIPYWLFLDAKEKNVKIDAVKFSIYHLYQDQKVINSNPEKVIPLNKKGEIITIPY